MNITFDANKDASNMSKHGGVSLAMASDLDWASLRAKPDTRRAYGELRMIGYALLGSRLFCLVFTDRGAERRVISLRRANSREVKDYVDQD